MLLRPEKSESKNSSYAQNLFWKNKRGPHGSSIYYQIFEEQYRPGHGQSGSPTMNHSLDFDPTHCNDTAAGQPSLDRPSHDIMDARVSTDAVQGRKTSLTLKSSSIMASTNQRMKKILHHGRNQQIGEPGFDVVSLGSTGTSAVRGPRAPAAGRRVGKASFEEPPIKVDTINIKEADGTRILHDLLHEQNCATDVDLASPQTLASAKGVGLTNKLQ